MLIFTVEHRTREKLLQLLNGGSGDVIGEVGQVGRPQLRAQRLDRRFGHGWDAVLSAPLENAFLKKGKEFPFLGKDLVLKGAFGQDSDRRGQQRCKRGAR